MKLKQIPVQMPNFLSSKTTKLLRRGSKIVVLLIKNEHHG